MISSIPIKKKYTYTVVWFQVFLSNQAIDLMGRVFANDRRD